MYSANAQVIGLPSAERSEGGRDISCAQVLYADEVCEHSLKTAIEFDAEVRTAEVRWH